MYQVLWNFTIIGGIIKVYSYRLVPMIMAENPKIRPKDAITLSRKMMYKNKFQLFKMDFSFIFYEMLNLFSFGLFGIFFSNPYYTASIVEFYTDVKKQYINDKKENYELLND